jgi:hypothetical protein|tara:strand:- start:616 stop:906 length:291 start_codon:yes stop_codon:yes gene_type:complete
MRITKNQLRQIIKEELASALREDDPQDLTIKDADETAVFDPGKAAQKLFNVSDEDQDLADASIAARNKKKTQTAKEKTPTEVKESRRRKPRKPRRK